MHSVSQHLPTTYHISGLSLAEGLVFLDVKSAKDWLKMRDLIKLSSQIKPCTMIYYPSRVDGVKFRTTEELVAERNEAIDRENRG